MATVPNTDTVPAPGLSSAERPGTLPSVIAARLRQQIAAGDLAAGDQLPGHRELATRYGVSVGSVREAISMLVSAGLVETRMGRGTYVRATDEPRPRQAAARPHTAEELDQLLEARTLVEVQIARLAAERATAAQITELFAAVDRMEAALTDPLANDAADDVFHAALAAAAGNRYLADTLMGLRVLLHADVQVVLEATVRRFGDLRIVVDSHRRLAEAVALRDRTLAARRVDEIIGRSRTFLLGLYAMGIEPRE